jgi:hypothetical protein
VIYGRGAFRVEGNGSNVIIAGGVEILVMIALFLIVLLGENGLKPTNDASSHSIDTVYNRPCQEISPI